MERRYVISQIQKYFLFFFSLKIIDHYYIYLEALRRDHDYKKNKKKSDNKNSHTYSNLFTKWLYTKQTQPQPPTPPMKDNEILYQGRRYDTESNLYYFRARYYDPIMGRFLSTDPMGYKDSMNLYQAFNMNGYNFVDPWGLYGIDFHYHTIYYLIKAKGWSDQIANGIAGISQYVDENDITNSTSAINMAATMFGNPKMSVLFHFPGSTRTSTTKRNYAPTREMLTQYSDDFNRSQTLENQIKLGVSLHTFADSWAHEGFSGWWNRKNVRDSAGNIINLRTGSVRPNAGHADAEIGGHAPDLIILNELNKEKAIEAAKNIYELLPSGKGKILVWGDIKKDLSSTFAVYKMKFKNSQWKLLRDIVIKRLESLIKKRFKRFLPFNKENFKGLNNEYEKVVKHEFIK